jgi:hypothetical protein
VAQGTLAKGWSLSTLIVYSSSSSSHKELGTTIVVYSIDPFIQISAGVGVLSPYESLEPG